MSREDERPHLAAMGVRPCSVKDPLAKTISAAPRVVGDRRLQLVLWRLHTGQGLGVAANIVVGQVHAVGAVDARGDPA